MPGTGRDHSSFSLALGLDDLRLHRGLALAGLRLGLGGPRHDVDEQQVGVGRRRSPPRAGPGRGRGRPGPGAASLTSIRIESGIALARQVTVDGVHQLVEDAPLADAGRVAAELEPDLGLDRLVGADAGEVEVDDLLAQVVPLHVADEDRLGRLAQRRARPGGSTS